MDEVRRRELLVSKAWIQAVVVVVLFGFFVLGLLAYRTYSARRLFQDELWTRKEVSFSHAKTLSVDSRCFCVTG